MQLSSEHFTFSQPIAKLRIYIYSSSSQYVEPSHCRTEIIRKYRVTPLPPLLTASHCVPHRIQGMSGGVGSESPRQGSQWQVLRQHQFLDPVSNPLGTGRSQSALVSSTYVEARFGRSVIIAIAGASDSTRCQYAKEQLTNRRYRTARSAGG